MRISLSDLKQRYGGFIDDTGFLILQCPFHRNRFPSVLIWSESGQLRFKCKQGCSEDMLAEYFMNGAKKIYYMPNWKKVNVVNVANVDRKWAEERHKAFFANQLNMLVELKKFFRDFLKKLFRWNDRATVSEFFKRMKYKKFAKVMIALIQDEIDRCKSELNKRLEFVSINKSNNAITQEMIEYAKSVPIEKLYDFKRGKALCPFHEDHEPSLVVWKDRNIVRCFGCNRSWDAIRFIMDLKEVSFKEAVIYLNSL